MKFNIVIGNPPYQDISGRNSIYNEFIEKSITNSLVCMITRDNWMNGKAFKNMRENMIKKGSIIDIIHYPQVGEVFTDVQVSVAYFLWKGTKGLKTHYKCIRNNKTVVEQELDILNGIIYKSEISKSIILKSGGKSDWAKYYNTRSYPFMDQRKRLNMYCSYSKTPEYSVKVIVNNGIDSYVHISNFTNTDDVLKYNIMSGVIVNEASIEKPGNVLTNIIKLDKYEVASETWSLIASFNNELEADNCAKYIKTKFVRFIANQSVNGRSNVTDNTFECVPIQDFTEQSDIDWSQSIQQIDQQLYKKYNLTQEEIDYIERTIKPMQ